METQTDKEKAEFEQYLIDSFGVTWERGGIMEQFRVAIEAVERDAFQRGWNDREARMGATLASENERKATDPM